MKVAIMQPYFFPYIGYFQLIKHVDLFVLLDDVQFIRKGWINRNRILNASGGWQYINVPLDKYSSEDNIREVRASGNGEWKSKILAQCETSYRKKSPCYWSVKKLLNQSLDNVRDNEIAKINRTLLQDTCRYLGVDTPIILSSEENFEYSNVKGAGDWALEVSSQLGAKEYVNPAAGKELFDVDRFRQNDIRLSFLETSEMKYMHEGDFEPALSIIDVMMFNVRNNLDLLLNNYKVVSI